MSIILSIPYLHWYYHRSMHFLLIQGNYQYQHDLINRVFPYIRWPLPSMTTLQQLYSNVSIPFTSRTQSILHKGWHHLLNTQMLKVVYMYQYPWSCRGAPRLTWVQLCITQDDISPFSLSYSVQIFSARWKCVESCSILASIIAPKSGHMASHVKIPLRYFCTWVTERLSGKYPS
jgi:hypothetical protein